MSIILNSCAFFSEKILENTIIVTSNKPAIVSYNFNGKKVELGTTPLKIKVKNFSKNYNIEADSWIHFYIEAPGYAPESLLMKSPKQENIDFHAILKPLEWWGDADKNIPSIVIDRLGKNFQIIYADIRNGNLDNAFSLIENLIKTYPNAAILYDIKGSIYILKNNIELAIASYERSLQISKDNPDTEKILNRLKRKRYK